MPNPPHAELLDLMQAVAHLRHHLSEDATGTALMEEALNALCRYYKSDPIAREGRHVIQNVLAQHPHLHHSETRVADWGFEVTVSCDTCGGEEKSEVVNGVVDIAAALMLGRHESCKPKPKPIVVKVQSSHIN
jgi:hypothetical protein